MIAILFMAFLNSPCQETPEHITKKEKERKKEVEL
jgi:hypothetical protein